MLRRALGPLRQLVSVMASVDPMRPGRRVTASELGGPATSGEILVLADAFNDMLDRLETERRDSARRALSASERLRVARELHDEIGQSLAFVALRAGHAAEHPDTQAEALREIADAAQGSLGSIQRIAGKLRPEALDDLGLLNALHALCSRVTAWGDVPVERDLQGPLPELDRDVELVIYRVAQEALTNAVRHSAGSAARISLRAEGDAVVLTVRDDGVGLPSGAPEGNGITGMRERAVLIGARLAIESVPGEGVEVRLTVDTEQSR
jgi:two-component system sensor histidine kinase UhpB